MAIPNVEDLSIEILNSMRDGVEYTRKTIIDEQRRRLLITKEDETKFQISIGFAITRLFKFGMIKRIDRGNYRITDWGIEQLTINREELNRKIANYNANVKRNRIVAYEIFRDANKSFLKEEKENINRNISERNLCQNLAKFLGHSMYKMRVTGILCRGRI